MDTLTGDIDTRPRLFVVLSEKSERRFCICADKLRLYMQLYPSA